MECDARHRESDDHPRCTPDHDSPPSNPVDPFERDESEYKVGSRNDETDSRRSVKADFFEEGCGIVNEGVKTAELAFHSRRLIEARLAF